MTVLDAPPTTDDPDPAPSTAPPPRPAGDDRRDATVDGISTRGIVVAVGAWVLLLVVATAAVLYPLGPLFQRRDQEHLLDRFRVEVQAAADATEGLAGLLDAEAPTAPEVGQPTAILDIGRLRLTQVVVEGVGPDETRRGPGHVPGTAGLGQPGNSVVVGRRAGWGGPFGPLDTLREGDPIVATTVQGRSLYVVRSVRTVPLEPDETFGPTDDDRLTLVTSASRGPLGTDRAVVVEARMEGRPYEPTPQGGRSSRADGRQGAPDTWATLALFGACYVAAAAAAAALYRRWTPLTAYLLTAPAMLVFAILTAESIVRLLPAWA